MRVRICDRLGQRRCDVEVTEAAIDKQKPEKVYRNEREFKTYLTEKYDCLKSADYSVAISSSLLSKALGDEKTAKWLEYNLSLIPEFVRRLAASERKYKCIFLSRMGILQC